MLSQGTSGWPPNMSPVGQKWSLASGIRWHNLLPRPAAYRFLPTAFCLVATSTKGLETCENL